LTTVHKVTLLPSELIVFKLKLMF